MRYLLILLIFLLIGIKSFSQSQDLPKYILDSTGHKIGVLFSVKQAQTINNDLELIELMEKMELGCDTVVKSYKVVVTNLDKVIATQDVEINELDSLNKQNNKITDNLKDQIKQYIADQMQCDNLVSNKDKEIGDLRKDNLKLKTQKIVGFTLVGGIGGVVIALLLYTAVHGTLHF